jgi:toxin FitB
MYILDTNVISELRQGKANQSPSVRAWAAQQLEATLFITAVTVLELERGIRALERREPPQGGALRLWLIGVRAAFAGRILPFTENTAVMCGGLRVPHQFAECDAMIAASALEHRFTVVTRNTSDFVHTGVPTLNPWLT